MTSAFFLAELGDKTMLATVTLASTEGWLGTWIGATLAMLTINTVAVAAGTALGHVLPHRVIRIGTGVLFLAIGAVLVVQALR